MQNSTLCPFCGKKVRQRNDRIYCAECKAPVHVQCIDNVFCVCFRCLERLGDSAKNVIVDPVQRALIQKKRKSLGL